MNSLMMISCWSKHVGVLLSVFSVWHFKLIFYYIDVHLLAHYIQWINMKGETVKRLSLNYKLTSPLTQVTSAAHSPLYSLTFYVTTPLLDTLYTYRTASHTTRIGMLVQYVVYVILLQYVVYVIMPHHVCTWSTGLIFCQFDNLNFRGLLLPGLSTLNTPTSVCSSSVTVALLQ
jgi:hypothetical protein